MISAALFSLEGFLWIKEYVAKDSTEYANLS